MHWKGRVQGVTTSNEVQDLLKRKGWEKDYPLFTTINRVVNGKLDPTWVMKYTVCAEYCF
jgi:glycerol-3-phosphate dehydrogenase (NAD+)